MISYRFKRRAFLTALSGGVGLKIMLRNLEGSAQGMKSPARLLVTQWPLGIVAGANDVLWKPTAGSVGGSPALKPFADAGLGPDITTIRGLSTAHLMLAGGGGPEQGMVELVTGKAPVATRANCCEGDDAVAAPGGSYDQLLLNGVMALQRPGSGYANSIGDARTDFGEMSTQCLSYSTTTFDVNKYSGGTVAGAVPLKPVLSPLTQYQVLFNGLVPGTGGANGAGGRGAGIGGASGSAGVPGGRVADATLKKLVGRRSVLDFAIEELNQLKRLAPSGARGKLTIHTDAVVAAEASLVKAINAAYPSGSGSGGAAGGSSGGSGSGGSGSGGAGGTVGPSCGGTCTSNPGPPPSVMGGADPNASGSGNSFGRDTALQDDAPTLAAAGKAHLDVLKAAFTCDLIRVGTFQWASATNHVGFALYPGSTAPYQHYPLSHRINAGETTTASTVGDLQADAHFLYNVQLWYFARHAESMASWKSAVDGCGNGLLDSTCVPFLTEVGGVGNARNNMPAMLIGGKSLGFNHNRYAQGQITINQLWGTIAQAYGYSSTDAPFAPPVPGFWTKPT